MNNIAKHSRADLVRLALGNKENGIGWVIRDNGKDSIQKTCFLRKVKKRTGGLTGMRERTELSGATFAIETELSIVFFDLKFCNAVVASI
jgi:signal transduction histidine kinase